MHLRSLQLFTPATRGKPNAEFLPSQILVALVLASVKLDCVQVGRGLVEDWLSRRNHSGYDTSKEEKQAKEDAEGYDKVLEIYCLHVLPRLEDWDYAREFLQYESELPQDRRLVRYSCKNAVLPLTAVIVPRPVASGAICPTPDSR
jgi:hypothetical protein